MRSLLFITTFIIVATTSIAAVQTAPPFKLIYPAVVRPAEYSGRTVGHFGVRFVPGPETRFFPAPPLPKVVEGKTQPGVIKAALRISRDGKVVEVAILDQTPEGVADESFQKFFRKILFVPDRDGKKAVECETEIAIVFTAPRAE